MPECDLCGLPTSSPIERKNIDGEFCCRGCLEVYKIVEEKGEEKQKKKHEDKTENTKQAFFAVEGMHCSTCEEFIEIIGKKKDGILEVDANYATETAKIIYDPEKTYKKEISENISTAGYNAKEINKKLNKEKNKTAKILVGGFFGMMVMVWYTLFLYPNYLNYFSLIDLSSTSGIYLLINIFFMSSIIVFYTGFPILRGMYVSIRAKRPNMDLLIGIAIISSYIYSTVVLISGGTEIYYDISVAVVLVVTVGNYYKNRIKNQANSLLSESAEERINKIRLKNGKKIPPEDLNKGDRILVKKGERIPADGKIIEGNGSVDESLITGESLPINKKEGDKVIGGSTVTENAFIIKVDHKSKSTLNRIKESVLEAQASNSGKKRIVDKIASAFVPTVLVISFFTVFINFYLGNSITKTILIGLSILIVSCPCSLGLATPLAVASGIKKGLSRGIIIKDSSVFEKSLPDTVAFDKTGTISEGEIEVTEKSSKEAIERAAAVEKFSSHPIAEAITSKGSNVYNVKNFEEKNNGVTAFINEEKVGVGELNLFRDLEWEIPKEKEKKFNEKREEGKIPVAVGWSKKIKEIIVVEEKERKKWTEIIEDLGEKYRLVLITGDSRQGAKKFEDKFDEVFSQVPPEGKEEIIRNLNGDTVMIGDGSNDGPALAAADIGIAFGEDAMASSSADVVLTETNLSKLKEVFNIVAETKKKIKENLSWAFIYNIIAIPLAVTGYINPLFAALAMSISSLLVVTNSLK